MTYSRSGYARLSAITQTTRARIAARLVSMGRTLGVRPSLAFPVSAFAAPGAPRLAAAFTGLSALAAFLAFVGCCLVSRDTGAD
ncbi:hypothetical protein GCM10007079_41520 [Nocardiopsis terrae]|nr:hypothetical protein GCM10007079_41520 [Nocardiopsis terrae]